MSYRLHPEAANEHKQQVAYYENEQKGLGQRYHAEFKAALAFACEMPLRPRVIHAPTYAVSGSRFFTSALFTVRLRALCKLWRWRTIAVSRAIGSHAYSPNQALES